MIVEHEVVTVLDEARTFDVVRASLAADGFDPAEQADGLLVLRRGGKRPHRGDPNKLPQTVRLEYDRGRVSIACSIMQPGKVKHVHKRMMLGLANGLERMLVHRQPVDEALADFRLADAEASDAYRRRRVQVLVWLGLIGLVVAITMLAVYG